MDFWNTVVKAAKAANEPKDGDYIQDGLLMCGKCHTPKQVYVQNPFTGNEQLVGCMCKCKEDAVEKERKRKVAEANRKYIVKAYGGIERLADFAFSDAYASAQQDQCKGYCEHFDDYYKSGTGMLLYGNLGTGKTSLACAVANELFHSRGTSFCFMKIRDVASEMMNRNGELWDRLHDDDLIIIDDLGADASTDFRRDVMFSVIDRRYDAGKPMIITTNLSLEDFKSPKVFGFSRCGERILHRCLPIKFDGTNFRRKDIRETFSEKMKKLLDK